MEGATLDRLAPSLSRRIKMFGKEKKEQSVIIITAKGIAEHDKLEAGTLCFADPDRFQAWELDYNQQAKEENKGHFTQFVSTLNKKPLKIFDNRPQLRSQSANQIAAQQFDEQLVQVHQAKQKQSMLLWLGIISLSILLMIGLIVFFNIRG